MRRSSTGPTSPDRCTWRIGTSEKSSSRRIGSSASSGNSALATLTLSRTFWSAKSRSVPETNSTFTVETLSSEVEVISLIPSRPWSSRSSSSVSWVSTSPGAAPGHSV